MAARHHLSSSHDRWQRSIWVRRVLTSDPYCLHQGKFIWAQAGSANVALEHAQLNALVLGLPWQRVGSMGSLSVV